jgi:GNAT superfamily N-acetyltransferase
MDYLISTCREEDLSAVVLLCANHAAYERAAYDPTGKEERLKQLLFGDSPRLFCIVVVSNDKIVGYATYSFDYSTWDAARFLHLDCLYLEPGYRGFNIGERIMWQLAELAEKSDCINMQWQTPDFNEGAIKFYHRIGASGKMKLRFSLELTR